MLKGIISRKRWISWRTASVYGRDFLSSIQGQRCPTTVSISCWMVSLEWEENCNIISGESCKVSSKSAKNNRRLSNILVLLYIDLWSEQLTWLTNHNVIQSEVLFIFKRRKSSEQVCRISFAFCFYLVFGVFDQNIWCISDSWAGGFSSCQIKIQHS